MPLHVMYTVRTSGVTINYFYTKEKRDRNGNPRYKVYITDPDAPVVYETIVQSYESQIEKHVIEFIEAALC